MVGERCAGGVRRDGGRVPSARRPGPRGRSGGVPLLLAGGAALLTVVIGGTCTGSGVADAPSALAIREIPAGLLRIYEQVGAQFKIPWEVLAGIGQPECDQGRLPDPSCTPQPGAAGAANFAGASGLMQIGVGGLAGDEYQSLRRYLPDPSLGPHNPTTAVELAALVLIRDKGAPIGQPIDAYAEDPAERRCGRTGGRAGCRAADDRGRQPDQPLRLQLRRRPRRSGPDNEPVQPEPSGRSRGAGERRPRLRLLVGELVRCCGAADSGRACSVVASWCRASSRASVCRGQGHG